MDEIKFIELTKEMLQIQKQKVFALESMLQTFSSQFGSSGSHPMLKSQIDDLSAKEKTPAPQQKERYQSESIKQKKEVSTPKPMLAPSRDSLPWSEKDEQILIDMMFAGSPGNEIAAKLERKVASIHQRTSALYKQGRLIKENVTQKKKVSKPEYVSEIQKSGYF